MRTRSYHTGRYRAEARGFTLIEAVVSIVLIGVLAMAVIPVISTGVKTYATTTTSINTLSKLRVATERMAREMREVRRNLVTPANYDLTMGANSVVFYKTDGYRVTIAGGVPNITLTYLSPGGVTTSGTLTNQVNVATDLVFTYYDIAGAVTSSLSQVAYVQIDLRLTEDGAALRQVTRVALRNQQ